MSTSERLIATNKEDCDMDSTYFWRENSFDILSLGALALCTLAAHCVLGALALCTLAAAMVLIACLLRAHS